MTNNNANTYHVGVDGCKNGWVATALLNGKMDIQQFRNLSSLFDQHGRADNILIDIPIGLAQNKAEEAMRPERFARKMLPGKSSTIFNAPCKPAAFCETYDEANEINKQLLGKGLSKQSFYICNKIREVDLFLKKKPVYREKLYESHPELCFAMLNPDHVPVQLSKKTACGRLARLDILENKAPETAVLRQQLTTCKSLRTVIDDVIDAFCLAVVARIGADRGFISIPENPAKNAEGEWMKMVYAV